MTINGQILSNSSFAYYIGLILKENLITNIVEIGTWKGLGSTKVIIDNIIKLKLDCKFISIESNAEFYDTATKNLVDYIQYVHLLYGKIVESQDLLQYIEKNPKLSTEQQSWLEQDLKNIKLCPNILDQLPNNIDFLLLDGGEFSTYAEWNILKNKAHFIALDDTRTMKCNMIRSEILSNSQYKIIVDSMDRNGFMLIKNMKYEI